MSNSIEETQQQMISISKEVVSAIAEKFNQTGEFTPTGIVITNSEVGIVPFRSLVMTTVAREVWLDDVRKTAADKNAFAAATVFKGRFRWSNSNEPHDVVIVLIESKQFGYVPLVADIDVKNYKIGELQTFAERAKKTTGMTLGKVKSLTGRFGRLLPKHWMN